MRTAGPIPLRLDPDRLQRDAVSSFVRAALAIGLAGLDRDARTGDIIKRFDNRASIEAVLRAAQSPSSTSNTPLTQVAVALLDALRPASAGADLLARSIGLSFDGSSQITVPNISLPTASFVAEGAPIPVVTAATSVGPTLTPHKIAAIALLTGELMRSSNAEQLTRQVLIEATGPALDAALFSADAADADQPAGLLNGIAGLTPATVTSGKAEALVDDLAALASAVAPVAGNGDIIIIAAPAQAVAVKLRLPAPLTWPVLMSASLADGTVIAVAPNAVASAIDGVPQIEVSKFAEIHRETDPQPIVRDDGSVAYPVASTFQCDEIALKLRWSLSWGLRSPTGIAWMENVNW